MPILDHHSLEIISRSAEQTRRVGMRLGTLLQPGDLIGLVGDLGSGKTTLAQGIAAGWGSLDPVCSPTFVLVNVYRRPDGLQLYHLDAYRLSGPAEAIDLDLDSMLERGPMLVEWAERVQEALPSDGLWVHRPRHPLPCLAGAVPQAGVRRLNAACHRYLHPYGGHRAL
jgi:tRNA threonylcarbamoyladenosine biosynthesis protein TsaE